MMDIAAIYYEYALKSAHAHQFSHIAAFYRHLHQITYRPGEPP